MGERSRSLRPVTWFSAVCASCHKTAVRAIILQSPLLSVFRVVMQMNYTLPGDIFANVDKINKVKCPVYVVHGTKDDIVPLWHGEGLYENCEKGIAHDPYWVEDGGHNNLELVAREPFYEKLSEFLKTL